MVIVARRGRTAAVWKRRCIEVDDPRRDQAVLRRAFGVLYAKTRVSEQEREAVSWILTDAQLGRITSSEQAERLEPTLLLEYLLPSCHWSRILCTGTPTFDGGVSAMESDSGFSKLPSKPRGRSPIQGCTRSGCCRCGNLVGLGATLIVSARVGLC